LFSLPFVECRFNMAASTVLDMLLYLRLLVCLYILCAHVHLIRHPLLLRCFTLICLLAFSLFNFWVSIYDCLSVCLSIFPSACLSVHLFIHFLSVCPDVFLFNVYLSVYCRSVLLAVYLYDCLSMCLYLSICLNKHCLSFYLYVSVYQSISVNVFIH